MGMPVFRRRRNDSAPAEEPQAPLLPGGPIVRPDGLRTLGSHRDYLLSMVNPLEPFGMALVDAWGLALCEQITAADALLAVDPLLSGLGVHDVLAAEGRRVDSRLIGLLAAVGVDKVLARPRPRVVVISVGTHLAEPGEPLSRIGQEYDAGLHMISAAAKASGVQVFRVPAHTDDPDALQDLISDQLIRADLLLSVGRFDRADDLVPTVLRRLGPSEAVEVAMKPAGLQGFALVGEEKVPMVPLAGDAAAAYVSFQAFVLPVIRRLMGIEAVNTRTVHCVTERALRSQEGVVEFVPAVVGDESGRHVSLTPVLDDGDDWLVGLARANALALLPEDTESVRAGGAVDCWELDHD